MNEQKDTSEAPSPEVEMANWLLRLTPQPFPLHVKEGLSLYLGAGIRPGSYLTAVLENDLREAVKRADDDSERATFAIVRWLYNHAPSEAWGSVDAVKTWMEQRWQERQRVAS